MTPTLHKIRVEGDGSFEPHDSYYQIVKDRFVDVDGEWVLFTEIAEADREKMMDAVAARGIFHEWFARGCNPGGMEWTPWVGPGFDEGDALAMAMGEYEE